MGKNNKNSKKNVNKTSKGNKTNVKKKNNKRKSKNTKLKKGLIIAGILTFLLILVVIGIFAGIFFSDKFAITKEDLLIAISNTVVYDSEGNVIAELSGDESRKVISMAEMSEHIPKAFIAIEDERFDKHKGIDVKRTGAAVITYVFNGGDSSFGGSTITQQLVKNITNEKSRSGLAGIERKIKEMSRAYQIEKILSKTQILEIYLNLIPLGASGKDLCGVEIASIYYFDKSAKDLNLEEAAFLAGINNAPNKYNPFKELDNNDLIKNRTLTVLAKMKELKSINEEQYNEAVNKVNEGLSFKQGVLPASNVTSYHIASAIDQIVKQLVEEKDLSEDYARSLVYSGGYKIHTTQVSSIQNSMTDEYRNDKYIKASKKTQGAHTQSAMVMIEQSTGKVVACMGGLGSDVNATGLNRINSARQPGSAIKPIVSYGAGVYYNTINAGTIYDNSYTTFGNYGQSGTSAYSGLCNIRQAIEVSTNAIACKILSEIGPDKAIDFARELGITSLVKAEENSKNNDSNLSLALGGITYGISTLEMAAAYAAIANDGVYITPTFYTKVEDADGNTILTPKQEKKEVMSADVAYIIKSIMQSPVSGARGTARNCAISGMSVGAKTGTTNDNYDRWLCGFTPYYTAASWYGYDINEAVVYSGNPAAHLWAAVMKKVHTNLPSKTFQKTANIVTARICRASGKLATETCTDTYSEEFISGTVPSSCEGHISSKVCVETGKIANEYCKNTHQITGIVIPEKEKNANWRTNPGNKYITVPTEICNVHHKIENENQTGDETGSGTVPPNDETPVPTTDITVKNVIGKTESEAKALLEGLKVDVDYTNDTTKPNGVVTSQSRPAGTILAKGGSITIVVNKNNTDNTP